MRWLGDLWHVTVANAQVGLSYFWLAIFAVLATMEGLGMFKVSIINQLTPITVMVASFWFSRQRNSTSDGTPPLTTPQPSVTSPSMLGVPKK